MAEYKSTGSNEAPLLKIGKRIQKLRKDNDLTIERLAEKTGLSVQSICKIESGSRDFKVSSLIAISTALGVSTDYILGLSEYDENDNIICLLSELSPQKKAFIRGVIELVVEL